MSVLKNLFEEFTQLKEPTEEQMVVSGSNRKYYRLKKDDVSLVGVVGTSKEENRAFIEMTKHFTKKALPVPQFKIASDDNLYYLQEDLGDVLLFDYVIKGRQTHVFSSAEKEMLHKVMAILPRFQIVGAQDFDFSICYPQPEFNLRSVMWDLNYFKYSFLKPSGMDFQENLLEDDFESLANDILAVPSDSFLYRDFQSRNVMIRDGEPYFIDYQGGRKGPVHYDVASFLWQARAQYGEELRNELLKTYYNSLSKYKDIDEKQFREELNLFVLFRLMQVLGAYGYRGYFEKKPHFLKSIPFAMQNLKELLENSHFSKYPYLLSVLNEMVELKQFQDILTEKPLVITLYSFSYKKGIPADDSGNGGGYVFDCRAVNNPGKYERYYSLTGLDEPVIQFLEEDGEILKFLNNSFSLIDASTKRYIDRKFTNLMISFGCTGGQHRSVYAAQKAAVHLNQKFGVEVRLVHREQNIEQIFPSRDI